MEVLLRKAKEKKIIIGLSLFFTLIFSTIAFADTSSTLRPTADGGDDSAVWTNTGGTACSATNCYLEVDESAGGNCTNSDGDTSVVHSNNSGEAQTFDIDESSIPDGATVTQIAITVCYAKTGGAGTFQTRQCHDGVCANSGVDIIPAAAYNETTQQISVNYIKEASSDIEIGIIDTDATKKFKVSQISAAITYTPPSGGGGNGNGGNGNDPWAGTGEVEPRKVVFSGQAYPQSTFEIISQRFGYEDAIVAPLTESIEIDDNGIFEIQQTGFLGAPYLFFLKVIDKDGQDSGILSFDVNLRLTDELMVENILVSPTLDFDQDVIIKDQQLKIFGYSAPDAEVEIEVNGNQVGTTTAQASGFYSLEVDTFGMNFGENYIRARQIHNEAFSEYSFPRAFKVSALSFPKADFNNDSMVDISDWSIFLLHWGSDNKTDRLKADLDENGELDIADFSIFLQTIRT